MLELQRLVYASRARLPLAGSSGSIHPELARILTQSRRNNPRRGLVGALYFRDDCFFQCLEGDPVALDRLLEVLRADPRHYDLVVLSRASIARLSFETWSMKYVPDAREVRKLLAKYGRDTFEPHRFEPPLIDALVSLLLLGPDAPIDTAARPSSASAPDVESRVRWALGLSSAAVVLAIAAIVLPLLN